MNPIIDLTTEKLPTPRLELRWEKVTGKDYNWECVYLLVIPLGAYDIRKEDKEGNVVRTEKEIELGKTLVQSNSETKIREYSIETPLRDGCHIQWDSSALKLPAYVTSEGKGERIEII